jgi:uncharacterized protein
VNAILLDVNVLIALAWPAHSAHERVLRWFATRAEPAWATCAFTQAAFVRILSNPAFSPDALTTTDAISLLATNVSHSAHRFWSTDIGFNDAIRPFRDRIIGHQQITDAYLLGLAIRKKGRFATLDRSVLALVPSDSAQESTVELIETGS